MKFFLSLALLAGALVSTDALSCWTCSNVPDLAACRANGKLQMCQEHEQSCQDEFRRGSYGTMVTKGCKEPQACENKDSQRNPAVDTSVCRCWCYSDECNSFTSCVPPTEPPAIPTTVPPPPTCDAPSAPEDGTVHCSEEGNGENVVFLEGSTCEYRCNPGFALIGESITTCSRTPEDSTKVRFVVPDPLECRKCDMIKKKKYLVVDCSNENNVGSTCEFTCEDGRTISPPRPTETMCQKNAEWTAEPPCCIEQCKPQDVGIVLDSSSTIGPRNWKFIIAFTVYVIDLFQLGPGKGRIGVYRFNKIVDTDSDIPLNKYLTNKDALIKAVKAIPYNGNGTRTGNALKYAYKTFFKEENGDRPDFPNVLLVVTDGKGNDGDVIKKYSKKLYESAVTVHAVPVVTASEKDTEITEQLETIALNGSVFPIVRRFQLLDKSMADVVGSAICTERACP